ncbi:alpha-hydroxy acid oxidase [Corynebacterium sp. J010B-136]|uniref:alpha-hydroxy acid oxidase n=1 Tax=Corynebacterium sp. J010B-136 TaxID=2099401 RepID=UPI000CF9EC32|nr:alpha-hydroxy acid oxidase [Corynebacterium sp. J010B-136]PQM74767.1 alpha-hydroxy-acid oxidizing enzyme [Corynebacterium sp. J010B-136]
MKFKLPTLDRRAARLASAANVWNLRKITKRRTPTPAFDYTDGAAQDETTLNRSYKLFREVTLIPKILHSTPEVDLSTTIAGGASSLPFGIAPTGFTRFMHSEGEDAGASAAAKAGIPFSLSTMGTRSVEEVARVSETKKNSKPGSGRRWFQLYLWKDREASKDLLARAQKEGFDTLLVTVDTPVAGQRLRDTRDGMTIPPQLTAKTVLDASYRPEWWFNFLTTDPLTFASLSNTAEDLASILGSMFDPSLSIEDLKWIREVWKGPLFVKGILTADDSRRATDAGADGLVVSNHGGRQLDRSPVSIQALSEVRKEAGPDVEIILDSGVMSGADIVAALGLGADFVIVGRAYLYGLMAGGEQGVDKTIELLAEEVRNAMLLMGTRTIEDRKNSGQVIAPWLKNENENVDA